MPLEYVSYTIPLDDAQWTIYNAQVDEVIETKYLAQEHKHVGGSGARTHGLVIRSPALFDWITRVLKIIVTTKISKIVKINKWISD